jgi:hypothetical protein
MLDGTNPHDTSDDLLRDLEESIPQGVSNSTEFSDVFDELDDLTLRPTDKPAKSDVSDPFADLEGFLSESLDQDKVRSQHKLDLAARKKGFQGMSKAEVDFCNSRMQAFELARIWRATENIAVFTRFCCSCGQDKLVFTRWMQAQVSRVVATTKHWDTVAKPIEGLPTTVAFEERKVDLCAVCAVQRDFDTHNMKPLAEVLK